MSRNAFGTTCTWPGCWRPSDAPNCRYCTKHSRLQAQTKTRGRVRRHRQEQRLRRQRALREQAETTQPDLSDALDAVARVLGRR